MSMSLMQMLHAATPRASMASSASFPAATSSSSSSSSSTAPGVDLTQTFLQLLSVQLTNQSPLDPVDPNQFTVELAQFDSLGELTQIQADLQTLVSDVNPPASQTNGAQGYINSISPPRVSATNLNSISH